MASDGSSTPAQLESEIRASVSGGSGGGDGGAAYEGPDRISSLADTLLHHILVFLPVVEAIRTCVLSSRWARVWTGLPRLHLDDDAAEAVDSFPALVDGVLRRYDASVNLRDLTISAHGEELGLDNDDIISCVAAAARLVTGRFYLDVSRGIDISEDYDEETNLLDLPCFERATEIAVSIADMAVLLTPDGHGRTFALLTKLRLSETFIADEGELLSEVVSYGCPRLRILELVDIHSGARELTIHTTSLLTLCVMSINDMHLLEVDAANLRWMKVKDCFDIEAAGSVLSLSTPAMEEFYWEDCCPEEVKLVREPAEFLKKITCVDSALTYLSLISGSQSYYTRILELFSSTCTDVLQIKFTIKPESEEQKTFIHSVNLPYCSELELTVEKNQHTLAPTIVHLLKKSRWIRRFSLKISPKKIHIQCEPDCTCRQPSNWKDQEISLGSLEELSIVGFGATYDEKRLIYFIIKKSKVLRKVSMSFLATAPFSMPGATLCSTAVVATVVYEPGATHCSATTTVDLLTGC
uniref:F-box domain-containing protein n=1 Tax=Oryza punctata TaxID=4537 RepID=A0A0E0LLX7_ORYPU